MFIELGDRAKIGDNLTLAKVAGALPPTPLLLVSDVAVALNVGTDVVYGWIDEGRFDVINLRRGEEGKPFYKIGRESFLEFLKRRLNRG